MMRNIMGQDNDMWGVNRDGVTIRVPTAPTTEEKKLLQLDFSHLSSSLTICLGISMIKSKLFDLQNWSGTIWRRLVKEFQLRKIPILILYEAKKIVKRHGSENVQIIFNRLSSTFEELKSLS